jgi:putative MATE family efflux protein
MVIQGKTLFVSAVISQREAAQEKRTRMILEGPIGMGVLLIALPSVATMLLHTINGFLDRFFVSGLGTPAMAAVSICTTLIFTVGSVSMAISTAASALIARAVGAGDIDEARNALRYCLTLMLILAVAIDIALVILAEPLLRMQGLKGASLEAGKQYLLFASIGIPFGFVMFVQAGAFRGLGDTVRPLYVTIGSIVVHAGLNALLIPGLFGFPKLGVVGGALAYSCSVIVASILQFLFLRGSVLQEGLKLTSLRIPREWLDRINRIALPAGGQQLLRTSSMLFLQGILANKSGELGVAALGVGLVAESIAFMPGFAYSIAATAFVGQNLGAQNAKRATAAGWMAMWQAVGVMSVMGIVFVLLARPFAEQFATGADRDALINMVVTYLKIAAVSEPFLAVGMVLSGALQGAGDTRDPTIAVAVTNFGVRLPLAYVLLVMFGTSGCWWAMTLSTMLQGLVVAWMYQRGHWKRLHV